MYRLAIYPLRRNNRAEQTTPQNMFNTSSKQLVPTPMPLIFGVEVTLVRIDFVEIVMRTQQMF